MLFILGTSNETSADMARAFNARGLATRLVEAWEALALALPGDAAISRLDVRQTLDGVEPGLLSTLFLERRGIRVVNRVQALLAAHDKLRTALLLEGAGLPHPRTALYGSAEAAALQPPLVLKPRFGSWGRDVYLCASRPELETTVRKIVGRSWFLRHGAVVQEYIPVPRQDLRVLVAGGDAVGAATRIALPGEWRTNVSIGGTLEPVELPRPAAALAVAAVDALGGEFMGVDLIPGPEGGYLVLEVNAAAEFDQNYAQDERDIFVRVAEALDLVPSAVGPSVYA